MIGRIKSSRGPIELLRNFASELKATVKDSAERYPPIKKLIANMVSATIFFEIAPPLPARAPSALFI